MEYISKQSLLADLNEATPRSYFAFETMVREYPTEDVVPVVHAHWIEKEDCSVITDIPWSMCSACGEYSPKLLYCAFCGAKMDEEQ